MEGVKCLWADTMGYPCEAGSVAGSTEKVTGVGPDSSSEKSFALLSFMRERDGRKYSYKAQRHLSPPFLKAKCLLNSKSVVRTGEKDNVTPFLLSSNQMSPVPWPISFCNHPFSSCPSLSDISTEDRSRPVLPRFVEG